MQNKIHMGFTTNNLSRLKINVLFLTKFTTTTATITSTRAESVNSQYKTYFKNSILDFIDHHCENIKNQL